MIEVKSIYKTFGDNEVLRDINAVFKPGLTTHEITDAIERIIKAIQQEFPKIKQIFIEPVAKWNLHQLLKKQRRQYIRIDISSKNIGTPAGNRASIAIIPAIIALIVSVCPVYLVAADCI